MEEEWFKLKKYPHIGMPITIRDQQWVRDYIKNPSKIKGHSFLPLLHRSLVQRKFRADTDNLIKNKSGKRRRKAGKPKTRDLYFASHLDSLVFSYYNDIISKGYEKLLKQSAFNQSVVAYRKIPIQGDKKPNKCNIDFAKTAFEFIDSNSDKKLTAIVADVSKFFDNLDHSLIKKQWKKVLNETCLPPDHYNVFKGLTTLRYVEEDQLFEEYKDRIIINKGVPNKSNETTTKSIAIKSKAFLKEKNAIAYCTKPEFISSGLKLIISKKKDKGIPQGSPISATLANIYMLDFDEQVFDKLNQINGFYQRYSDDLIIICEQNNEDEILKFLRAKIQNLVKLEIHPDKTQVFRFETRDNLFRGFKIDESSKKEYPNEKMEYLGFSYDGQKVLIKTAGFSKYYRSMKRSFKRSASLAVNSKNPDNKIFKTRLYKRFTHRGAKRKLIYRQSTSDPNIYLPTKKQYWGNYISYINKSDESMLSLNKEHSIKKQGRKLWNRFHKLMNYHVKAVDDSFK